MNLSNKEFTDYVFQERRKDFIRKMDGYSGRADLLFLESTKPFRAIVEDHETKLGRQEFQKIFGNI